MAEDGGRGKWEFKGCPFVARTGMEGGHYVANEDYHGERKGADSQDFKDRRHRAKKRPAPEDKRICLYREEDPFIWGGDSKGKGQRVERLVFAWK